MFSKHKISNKKTLEFTIQQFLTPQTSPKSLKLPRVLPTRLSTNPSMQDHPAAIGVKISSTVLEEYTFTSKEIHFEAIAVQGYITNPC